MDTTSKYKIPFNKPTLIGKELHYISKAIHDGYSAGDGSFTKKCHALLEEAVGVPRVLLTTSCTDALEMSALLLDIEPGDEVIVPSFTFVSTPNAFVLHGARPVFADIRPDTLNIDENQLERLITPRTRAIVPVHYAGIGCEMDQIMAIADQHGLTVIEDNAHGLFGKYKGQNLGTFGAFATQSFHETKNFSCGEGGALLINDRRYLERAEIIREKGTNRSRFFRGQVDKYTWVDKGSSYLPSDILAAFLFAQLEERQAIQAKRQHIWETYDAQLRRWSVDQGVRQPVVPSHCDQSYHMYYLLLPSLDVRQRLIDHLKSKGILSVFHYLPLNISDMGQQFGGRPGDCPVTEEISDRLLRLPFFNQLTADEQGFVIESIVEFSCQPFSGAVPVKKNGHASHTASQATIENEVAADALPADASPADDPPLVSVIIPTYGGAATIEETIASVLNQTYPHLECLVVNDLSPDDTGARLEKITDRRLKVLTHEVNQGAVGARNTGLAASRGQYIAFLDQDDLFHPEKLAVLVDFLETNPEVGVAYNGRYDIQESAETVFRLWMPPTQLSLTEMIQTFPFAPSDTVFRRAWALREDIWDWQVSAGEEMIVNGGEYIYCGRLSFAGCQFAGVPRPLNYRRHHPGRIFSDLEMRCHSELTCQQRILDDPRCPEEVKAVRSLALATTYRIWSYYAYAQGEPQQGQAFLKQAAQLAPELTSAAPTELIDFMIFNAIADFGRDYVAILSRFFDHLPAELRHLEPQRDWAIARAFLLDGLTHFVWGRPEAGHAALEQAAARHAEMDEITTQKLVHQLVEIEQELGASRVDEILQRVTPQLEKIGGQRVVRQLKGTLAVNRAFRNYRQHQYGDVPADVLRAVVQEPGYLMNRGVLSILGRSLAGKVGAL